MMPINDRTLAHCAMILLRRRVRFVVIAILAFTLAGCASFRNADGEPAVFEQLNACEALGIWAEPLASRYGTSLKKMSEVKARPRLALLFEDTYFVPVFGAPIDALSGPQMAAISRSLGDVRKRCDPGTYLRDELPLFFLRDVFHHKPRMHAHITREFAIQHAVATRGKTTPALANSTGADRSTIRRTQRLLDRIGRDVGPIDGLAGERTLRALRDYKRDKGIQPIDDAITADLLARLQRDADATPTQRQPATPARETPRPRSANPELNRLLDDHAKLQRQLNAPDAPAQMTKSPTPADGDGSPAALMADLERLLAREPVRLTPANTPFLAGLSVSIMRECKIPDSIADRTRLTAFVGSAGVSTMLGSAYSSPDLQESLGSMLGANVRLSAGETAGARLGCGEEARAVTDGVLRAVKNASSNAGSGPTPFVRSCTPHFTRPQCECLGDAGRNVIADIHQQIYHREIVSTITARNPFVGMQIMATCGINRY